MMERSSQLTLFLSVFLLISLSVDASVKSAIVFGDSLFDPGNNHYVRNCNIQADYPPYGSTFFRRPTGRFTNGRTVADFIAQYLKIDFIKPFQEVHGEIAKGKLKKFPANGINFASAGSGVLPDTNKESRVTPIQVQLQQFQSLIRQKHLQRKQTKNSLFLFVSGSNDIFTYFLHPDTPPLTPRAYVQAMLNEVGHVLDQIYKLGARRIAIFSIGPIGCIPARVILRGATDKECYSKVNKMVRRYNSGLELLVHSIPIRYPGAIGVYGAVYNSVENYRDKGKLHGFANVNEACCGDGPLNGLLQCGWKGYKLCKNPDKFFFWDYFHPSERTYGLVAKDMWGGRLFNIRPMNLKTLAQIPILPIELKTLAPNTTLPFP